MTPSTHLAQISLTNDAFSPPCRPCIVYTMPHSITTSSYSPSLWPCPSFGRRGSEAISNSPLSAGGRPEYTESKGALPRIAGGPGGCHCDTREETQKARQTNRHHHHYYTAVVSRDWAKASTCCFLCLVLFPAGWCPLVLV